MPKVSYQSEGMVGSEDDDEDSEEAAMLEQAIDGDEEGSDEEGDEEEGDEEEEGDDDEGEEEEGEEEEGEDEDEVLAELTGDPQLGSTLFVAVPPELLPR